MVVIVACNYRKTPFQFITMQVVGLPWYQRIKKRIGELIGLWDRQIIVKC